MFKTIAGALVALFLCQGAAIAHDDNHQMGVDDPEVRAWYRDLKQPDNPVYSCCGEADAYWADSFECESDKCFAIITDEREDLPLGRPHIKPGTKIQVPPHKYKSDGGNPTGHGVIFVNFDADTGTWTVLCYIVPGGV